MNTSEKITELAKALSKAQSEMTGAKKSSKNPFFKSTYSDLASVMEAISGPFADNELSFVQSPGFDGANVTVTTRIMHSSGEWIEGTCTLPPTKNDAQGYGSSITYGKRYSLQSMAGVPSVDDDGNAAVVHKKELKAYPDADLKKNADLWAEMFDGGKTIPSELIKKISSKYILSDAQKTTINELGKQ